MKLFNLALALVACIWCDVVSAQYNQNLQPVAGPGNTKGYMWQPGSNQGLHTVYDIPNTTVILVYNCHYMTNICYNAKEFMKTTRGKLYAKDSKFHFDLATNKKTGRSKDRRDQSCPGKKWIQSTTCPETPYQDVFRNGVQWPSYLLENGTTKNVIEHERDARNKITTRSGMRYTCEEWPAASWVEGGSGSGTPNEGPSSTRCAAMRCGDSKGVKAEQDWQAIAHRNLGAELRGLAKQFSIPGFKNQDSIVTFGFAFEDKLGGSAAYVRTYHNAAPGTPYKERKVNLVRSLVDSGAEEGMFGANFHYGSPFDMLERLDALNLDYHEHAVTISDENDSHEKVKDTISRVVRKRHLNNRSIAKRRPTPPVNANATHPAHGPVPSHAQFKNATTSDIEKARKLVHDAAEKSDRLNQARYANPARNKYRLRSGTRVGNKSPTFKAAPANGDTDDSVPPLLRITDELRHAAALIAQVDAKNKTATPKRAAAAAGSYWMEHLDRKGTVPWGDDADYKIFRNVKDYGAVGDGVADDTIAFNKAMNETRRCGEGCNGSTIKNAIVYLPPGTYKLSSTIEMPFGTQIIGDANDRPLLITTSSFSGLGVISTDHYTGGGAGADGKDQEWFINTANFYRQIRNLRIDTTNTRIPRKMSGIHYQVAQATSIQNVEITTKAGHNGIFAENGSGGFLSDISFIGGSFGIYGGSQQFTAQRLKFSGCDVGVQIIWDWGWVWKTITMTNVKTGFKLLQEGKPSAKRGAPPGDGKGSNGNIGSIALMDSSFTTVDTAVVIAPPNSKPGTGSTGVVLDNIKLDGVGKAVGDTSGATILAASSVIRHWALGPKYSHKGERSFSMGEDVTTGFQRRETLIDKDGMYFERAKPQYEEHPVSDFVHVKDFGAKGDGKTDDTSAFQNALAQAQGRILFVDAGTYFLTSTVIVPPNTKMVGETWSQLAASGSYFSDASNPKVMLQVGYPGDVGSVEMQDLIFTNVGNTAGLVMVEWNIRAETPGSAGIWDCHSRVGGAIGTKLTPAECPALTSGTTPCNAGALMFHLTKHGSGYFENMWLWVADHMIDDPDMKDPNNDMVQISVYVARGFLIESQQPTWLYGTASEHSVYYQYNFHNARNIFAGMIQTETPYYQPNPKPPAPFASTVGQFPGDPDYKDCSKETSGCDSSWGVMVRGSTNIMIASAGIYSWFSTYSQDCIDTQTCQKALLLFEKNYDNVRLQNLITIGAKYSIVQDGKGILAKDNLNVDTHPSWSQISIFDVGRSADDYQDLLWIDAKIWDMDQPSFECAPPCAVKIPPWTGATYTVDYPVLTVTSGTWTTKITEAPITMTNIVFKPVTIEDGSNAKNRKRQGFTEFWPEPATVPYWPNAAYIGPDGVSSQTTPNVPFPTPPPSIGPDAAAPPEGSWPKKAILPVRGLETKPVVNECGWFDYTCYINEESNKGGDDDTTQNPDDDDDWYNKGPEGDVTCGEDETTTTSSAPEPTKTPPQMDIGNPKDNKVDCFNSGAKIFHVAGDNAIDSACRYMTYASGLVTALGVIAGGRQVLVNGLGPGIHRLYAPIWAAAYPHAIRFAIHIQVYDDCIFPINQLGPSRRDEIFQRDGDAFGLCKHYMTNILDGCNCRGIDDKQGGEIYNECYRIKFDPNSVYDKDGNQIPDHDEL